MISFLMLLALTLAQPVAPESHWCYPSQAAKITCLEPSNWPGYCHGSRQSPINIITEKTILNSSLVPFTFTNYDEKKSRIIRNNGHTVEVELDDSIKISGGGLQDTYKAVAFHMHWSDFVDEGSEHTVDGKSYAMELHIVHIKEKFQSLSEALSGSDNDEIAVLGFLIKASPQNNSGFVNLVENLNDVKFQYYDSTLKQFSLFDLIPEADKLKGYYRYWGSLTTPQCEEKVVWTVFHERIPLHSSQIFEFSTSLYYNSEEEMEATMMPMIDNYRKTQPLGDRQVFTSGVGILLPQAWPMLLAPLLTYLLTLFLY
ncbi:carbonic anhydrase 4 [Trichosurus vulpecula]|uniref:carbonic anhydrase 4 n=1 Tax=Trichosurus vulpecula TaxID=9337 RepID=UPI00186B0F6F|nr:carbonic anhydrase 4 [Trichosurus vulpecula]